MYCPRCGRELINNEKICPTCELELEKVKDILVEENSKEQNYTVKEYSLLIEQVLSKEKELYYK